MPLIASSPAGSCSVAAGCCAFPVWQGRLSGLACQEGQAGDGARPEARPAQAAGRGQEERLSLPCGQPEGPAARGQPQHHAGLRHGAHAGAQRSHAALPEGRLPRQVSSHEPLPPMRQICTGAPLWAARLPAV